MLHLRVTCPAEATDAVLDRLRHDPGVVHLSVLRGVGVDPPGDLVQADVAREAADEVLAALCALGIDHTGGITLEPLDTVLSDVADAAERAAPGDPADAVVWDGARGGVRGGGGHYRGVADGWAVLVAVTGEPGRHRVRGDARADAAYAP